jgi:hypothetical protein
VIEWLSRVFGEKFLTDIISSAQNVKFATAIISLHDSFAHRADAKE